METLYSLKLLHKGDTAAFSGRNSTMSETVEEMAAIAARANHCLRRARVRASHRLRARARFSARSDRQTDLRWTHDRAGAQRRSIMLSPRSSPPTRGVASQAKARASIGTQKALRWSPAGAVLRPWHRASLGACLS